MASAVKPGMSAHVGVVVGRCPRAIWDDPAAHGLVRITIQRRIASHGHGSIIMSLGDNPALSCSPRRAASRMLRMPERVLR